MNSRCVGMSGATPTTCTWRFALTKRAFRYQNLSGELASRG